METAKGRVVTRQTMETFCYEIEEISAKLLAMTFAYLFGYRYNQLPRLIE
jgi:hypothetical protein